VVSIKIVGIILVSALVVLLQASDFSSQRTSGRCSSGACLTITNMMAPYLSYFLDTPAGATIVAAGRWCTSPAYRAEVYTAARNEAQRAARINHISHTIRPFLFRRKPWIYTRSGGKRLNGEIPISGAKNAALPIIVASLLAEGETPYQVPP
jgi:hypothetical protein